MLQVDPYVPREPRLIPRPPSPSRKAQALDFYEERDRCLQVSKHYRILYA